MRVERLRKMMESAGLDVTVATSYENVAYLSGTPILTQRMIPERLAAVIVPLQGDPIFVLCSIEEAQAKSGSWITDIRGYTEFVDAPTTVIADCLSELNLERGRIGIESRVLVHDHFVELANQLPAATLSGSDTIFDNLRAVKDATEIEILRRAAQATDAAIARGFAAGRLGSGDKVIADCIAQEIQGGGADAVAFLVVGSGPTAAIAHPSASTRPLQEGDVVRCDVGGYYAGYYSDLARSAVAGRPTQEQVDAYRKLWEVHEAVIGAVREGMEASQLFRVCEREFVARGLEMRMPHIGHSLGLGLHENPMLHPANHTPLLAGMVIAIEPIVRLRDGSILHVEDQVVVTKEGSEIISRSRDWSTLYLIDG